MSVNKDSKQIDYVQKKCYNRYWLAFANLYVTQKKDIMKYFEFGTENKLTLLLLHGVDTTWQMSFQSFIDVARQAGITESRLSALSVRNEFGDKGVLCSHGRHRTERICFSCRLRRIMGTRFYVPCVFESRKTEEKGRMI